MHPQYGIGRIVAIDGAGPNRKGRVAFTVGGERTFVLAKSPLRPVDGRMTAIACRDAIRVRIRQVQPERSVAVDARRFDDRRRGDRAEHATSGSEHRPRRHAPAGPGGPRARPGLGGRRWPSSAGPTGSRSTSARTGGTSRTATCGCSARRSQIRLNLELSVEPAIVAIALEIRPDQVTLVPERRAELTTEGGLDVVGQRDRVAEAVARLPRRRAGGQPVHRPRPRAGRGVGRARARRPSSCTPAATPTPPTPAEPRRASWRR